MSTSESFANLFRLNPGSYTIAGSYIGSSYTISDTADGNSDGTTAVGDSVYGQFVGNMTLIGTSPNGIIAQSSGNFYLFTDSTYSFGQSIPVDTSSPYTYCFLAGTQINTPEGECSVEEIAIGDKVLAADGRMLTVRWMGHETIYNGIGASVHKAPVKISTGAMGNGLPHSDLYVSNAHAFLIDGHLVIASALINGDTITSVPFAELPEQYTYWHIETDAHELVVANGVAAETLSGAPERKDFDNYDSYIAEFGADRIIPSMAYPRIKDVAQLPDAILARFGLARPSLDWEQLLDDDNASVCLAQGNG
ncbi:MAG: Hint domain-containing protein [Paraglaciecola sp.]|uniref:Hint domain-containing protein n=1 Tax=Paraglaciecola sp. TaxID=1920173 RepID=UPI003297E552